MLKQFTYISVKPILVFLFQWICSFFRKSWLFHPAFNLRFGVVCLILNHAGKASPWGSEAQEENRQKKSVVEWYWVYASFETPLLLQFSLRPGQYVLLFGWANVWERISIVNSIISKKIIIIKPCNPPLTRVNETRRQVESSSAREVLSRITAILNPEGFLF